MKEILIEAFMPSNIIPTTLLLFAAGYWVIVLIGLVDMSSIDVDLDIDAEADLDLEVDIDADADIETSESFSNSVSWFNSVLIFFNLHNVPLMIFYSFLVLPMWMITMIANHNLGITSFTLSLIVLLPSFVICLFLAKYATLPVAKLFANIERSTESTNPIGKICIIALPVKPGKLGQGIVKDLNNNVVRLNLIGLKDVTIDKGQKALVIEYRDSDKAYLVEPFTQH
ncbi:MAG: DUF1449 family protein [Bacteroidia bacterium]